MAIQATHPSEEELRNFSLGRLHESDAEALEQHVSDCQVCCDTLLELSAEDTFAALLIKASDSRCGLTLESVNRIDDGTPSSAEIALKKHARYEVLGLIARGGMGEVFRAKHRVMDRQVALKVIKSDLMRNAEAVERFHCEVKSAAQASHPNIVTAYDADQSDGVHFLVMEFVDGINLADRVRRDGPLSVADACDAARQAAIGLQHAHEQGMVHRDMKPHNLMFTSGGTVKILDFGLVSLASRAIGIDEKEMAFQPDLTSAGKIMGTPDFIAPEQALDARNSDIRSDIYGLGSTLYFLLTGQPPFAKGTVAERINGHLLSEPTPLRSIRPDVPSALSAVIERMMAKDPDHRYQTPGEVAEALTEWTGQSAAKSDHHNVAVKASRWKRPPSKRVGLAFVAFVFLMGGIFYVQTDKGTLQIQSVDENVTVTVSNARTPNGSLFLQLNVVDTVTGSSIISLPSGDYKVSLSNGNNAYELNETGFTLRRGGEVVIKVLRKPGSDVAAITPTLRSMPIPSMAQQQLSMQGGTLTPDEADLLQVKIDEDENDLNARLKLMGYLSRNSIRKPELRESQVQHLSWLVENYPQDYIDAGYDIHASMDPSGYMRVKTIWLQQVASYPDNSKILRNSAKFLRQSDRPIATELLKKAKTLSPSDPTVPEQLGQLYLLGRLNMPDEQRKKQAAKALAEFEIALELYGDVPRKNSTLYSAAVAAFESESTQKAQEYSNELLRTGDGRSIHQANVILGKLALQLERFDEASEYLLAAGRVDGGPSLSSFGPNMSLAKEMLEHGYEDVVLKYFELCGSFWRSETLEQWKKIVTDGGIPDFGANLVY